MTGDVWRGEDGRVRCGWVPQGSPDAIDYHDTVWGTPTHDVRAMFEALALGVFEVGMSWAVVFNKRAAFRRAFDDFEPGRVATFTALDVQRLLGDPSIIRNRAKIEATVNNAQAILRMSPGLAEVSWSFRPARHKTPKTLAEIATSSAEAVALAAALKKNGLRFVGPTSIQSYLQSVGIVNDHLRGCFRAL